MDRDTFKKLSMGHYCYINLQGTIDKDEMLKFSEGAVWAYDFINHNKLATDRFMPTPINIEDGIYRINCGPVVTAKDSKWPT